jgi:SAM-dependent methyltransferase
VLDQLACPVCGEGLARRDATLRCRNGHSFDVARQGYVNLLTGAVPAGLGDSAAMVAARADFLAAGHYRPITEALVRAAGGARRIVDVGAGPGHHLAAVAGAVPGRRGLALDASKHAARRAARAHPRVEAVVADVWRGLPLRDGAVDAVLDVFAPRHGAEFARVLAPGGALIWHGGSRDGIVRRFLERDWWQTNDGTIVAHERTFDPLSGLLSIRSTWSGPSGPGERQHHIRLYTATRLAELCAAAGLIVEEAYDGWRDRPLSRRSTEMLLVARKRELPRARKRR